ncbi:MAG: hypothetical protein A2846_03870 [Candidatus Doudnabacteria bacterium RIFCSPHIGHO2_01_FULL_49_9]|uniref:Uncharacterized protein n=1 Tax=Candidatus Doudnabacteria bacterium RIFCSPHIGHO2_01_FULL_49_9 TaxID=1817827 RepID=A0A1F5P3B8_9BACT|nr:MAG: hypothetical protein A2846_03870 [Candidatus Doudnabacteria bacterium RIFCSPHIGHO2_01_FULL_49_9]
MATRLTSVKQLANIKEKGIITMNKIAVKEKLNSLEAEIQILKIAVNERPDFQIDEMNWKKIKPALKKARAQIYKETYG